MSEPRRGSFCARVLGPPQFVGNKRGFVNPRNGRVIIAERNSRAVRSWQDTLRAACAEDAPALPLRGPVAVHIAVWMRRPLSHYRTGVNAHLLRESAPARPIVKPDADKIARCCLDCLGAWVADDALVVELTVGKFYAGPTDPEATRVVLNALGVARREPGAGG